MCCAGTFRTRAKVSTIISFLHRTYCNVLLGGVVLRIYVDRGAAQKYSRSQEDWASVKRGKLSSNLLSFSNFSDSRREMKASVPIGDPNTSRP